MGRLGLKAWRSLVSEFPGVVQYFAYDFPRAGTWKEYTEWVRRVYKGVRGDPLNPDWDLFFNGPFPFSIRHERLYSIKERAYSIYRRVSSTNIAELWSEQVKYDMYVFPTGYVFVLPRNPYGWGMLFGLTVGVAYMLAEYFHVPKHPVHIWILPTALLKAPVPPFQVTQHRQSPLAIKNVPVSDEYAAPLDYFTRAMFAMRPLGVLPDGHVVVGYRASEQELAIGRIGKEVFLLPSTASVYRMVFKLAQISAYLSDKVFGRIYMGPHKKFNDLALVDYAMTMFHALLIADFPAYRAAVNVAYQVGEKPRDAPVPPSPHSFVFKTTGNAFQLPEIISALPAYVGVTYFPEVQDWVEQSQFYKNLLPEQ